MTTSTPPPAPNHHAHHPGFSGATGVLMGLTMAAGRRAVNELVNDLAGVVDTDHVVDVGCGPGGAARAAARRGASVTGVDPSTSMLAVARRLTPATGRVRWVEGAAERLPLPDGHASVVWSVASVHHWSDVDAGIGEAHRVLAPGGRLVVAERRTTAGATGHRSHGWTPEQGERFAALCRDAGLDDVQVTRRTAGRTSLVVVSALRP